MNLRLVPATLLAFAFVCVPASAGVVFMSFSVISSDPQENLFTSIGAPVTPNLLAGPSAAEAWPVTINVSHIQTLPGTVVLNVPNRLPESLSRLRSANRGTGAFMWTGGGEGCSALLSAIPGAFRATISCLGGTYGVETFPTGPQLIRYVYDQTPLGAEDDVAVPSSAATSVVTTTSDSPAAPESFDQVVDVMILYTSNVRQALQASNIDVAHYMQDTLDTTQMAMDRSTTPGDPVIAELYLVHAQEVSRAESGFDYNQDLDYLRLDDIPVGLRNAWAADLVMYMRETTPDDDLCGKAYVPGFQLTPLPGPGFAPWAVGVTKRECDFSAHPFQHELGHLFGANHERPDPPDPLPNETPLQAWAFAKWANAVPPEDSARTIVATKNEDCFGSCQQVLNYSNAAITLTTPWAFKTGTPDLRENARVIAEFAGTTAQYKPSLDRIFSNGFD